MSKRKLATASKRVRNPKKIARAQRDDLHCVAAAAIERPLKLHNDLKPNAPLSEPRVDALPADLSQGMRDSDSTTGIALATSNLQAYQAKLLEIAQDNGQFAFEFGLRLAAIRSPIEFFAVVTEFSRRRIDMFGQHSREIAAYPFWRTEASRKLTTLPGR